MEFEKTVKFNGQPVMSLLINGKTYFLGKNIAKILEFPTKSSAIHNHVKKANRIILEYKDHPQLRKSVWSGDHDYSNKVAINSRGILDLKKYAHNDKAIDLYLFSLRMSGWEKKQSKPVKQKAATDKSQNKTEDKEMIKDIIPIKESSNRHLVSARDLYKGLESKERFSKWFIKNIHGFINGKDYTPVPNGTPVRGGNGNIQYVNDYWLTIDTAKKIAMMARTKKGNEVRDYFIYVEKQLKQQLAIKQPDSYMIEDPIKRAKRWIQERKAYEEQKELADKQAKKIEHDKPFVEYAHAIGLTNHNIKIREMAFVLTQNGFKIGQNQLFNLLRLEHYLSKKSNLPLGDKMKRGYFYIHHGIARNGEPYSTTLITPKGQRQILHQALNGKFDENYQKVITNTFKF